MTTVVYPTDFSEFSEYALRQASALASKDDGRLIILHVKEPPSSYTDRGFAGYPADPAEQDEMLERKLLGVVPRHDVACERHLLSGKPSEEIVRYANSVDADMIVIGSHGRTGLMRALMGSVAEAVVRRAPCPVLTVKTPEPSKTPS